LLGVAHADSDADADWLADKVRALRVFPASATGWEPSAVYSAPRWRSSWSTTGL